MNTTKVLKMSWVGAKSIRMDPNTFLGSGYRSLHKRLLVAGKCVRRYYLLCHGFDLSQPDLFHGL